MNDRHPIWKLLDKIQMDNRDQAAKIVELRALFAALPPEMLPDRPAACEECGLSNAHLDGCTLAPLPVHDVAALAFAEARENSRREAARLARSPGERATETETAG